MDIMYTILIFIIGAVTGMILFWAINRHADQEETEEYMTGLLEQIRKNQQTQAREIVSIRKSVDALEELKLTTAFKLDFPKDYRKDDK